MLCSFTKKIILSWRQKVIGIQQNKCFPYGLKKPFQPQLAILLVPVIREKHFYEEMLTPSISNVSFLLVLC